MGFTPYREAQDIWEKSAPVFCKAARKIPMWATDEVINTIGAIFALGGIVAGIGENRIVSETPPRYFGSVSISKNLLETLKKYDPLKYEDAFKLRMEVSSKLGLKNEDAVIGVIDFTARKRRYYNLETGELLAIR